MLERFRSLIHLLDKSDRPSLKAFLSEHFHPRYILTDDVFFDWQYLYNPDNFYNGYAMKVIKEKERFLGYLGLIPYRLKLFDRTHERCGALCNLMIHGSCRALGLGSVLVKECQKDFLVMTGTDYNKKTAPMYKNLGNWFEMGDMHRFIFILNSEKCALIENPEYPDRRRFSFLKRPVSLSFSERFQIGEIKEFDEGTVNFWETVKWRYPITVERAAPYLNWRYSYHPLLKYRVFVAKRDSKVTGYLISRREQAEERNHCYIFDRIIDLIADEESERFLLGSYVMKMRDEGVDCIDFFFTGKAPIPSLETTGFIDVRKYGVENIPMVFSPIERHRAPINFLTYIDDRMMHLADEIKNIDNWYITRGDGDKDRPNYPGPIS
jgi:hypothetical protein